MARKSKKHKKLKLYLVVWRDAVLSKRGWLALTQITGDALGHNLNYSVGWFLGEQNEYVMLAGTTGAYDPVRDEVDDFDAVFSIPVGCVVHMQEVAYRFTNKQLATIKALKVVL